TRLLKSASKGPRNPLAERASPLGFRLCQCILRLKAIVLQSSEGATAHFLVNMGRKLLLPLLQPLPVRLASRDLVRPPAAGVEFRFHPAARPRRDTVHEFVPTE